MMSSKLNGIKLTAPIRAVMFAMLFAFGATAAEYWVDPENGSDANGGTSSTDAWLTLTNAAAKATRSGDVIWALPGTYAVGTAKNGVSDLTLNRVILKTGVTLKSTAGAKQTFIVGAASTEDPDDYGRGPGAVRCVYLNGTAKVSGFTITGGHTGKVADDYKADSLGGGVYCASGSGIVEDCIVSNNYAHASGGGHNLSFVRCRILENLAASGSAGWSCSVYGCVVDGNRNGHPDGACLFSYKKVYDTTFIHSKKNYSRSTASEGVMLRNGAAPRTAYGCVFLSSPPGQEKLTAVNCVYTYLKNDEFLVGEGSFLATEAEIALDADGHLTKGSKAIDKIATTDYDSPYTSAGDVDGGQRIFNKKRDMGASEFDWRGVYSADLAQDSLTITNATANAEEVEPLKIRLADGAALSGVWTPCAKPRIVYVTVTGTGSFALTADGETAVTVTEEDGETAVDFSELTEACGISLSFAGEGAAVLTRTAMQVTIPADDAFEAKLTVTGATPGATVVLNPGDTVTIAPNDEGTRFASGIVVNGETVLFSDLPNGTWSYAVPAKTEENSIVISEILYSNDWYVSPAGDNTAKGISPDTAWGTLAFALANTSKVKSGHRVLALPGHYREGAVQATNGNTAPHIRSRVNVPNGVTLESTDGAEVTFIHGAAATVDADEWGRGTNAIRCATVNGTLKGFTILDGRTRGVDGSQNAYDPNYRGAAVYGGTIKDCIISNCYGWCATAGQMTDFVRCRILDCWGTEYAAGWNCYYDSTLVDRMHDTCPNSWGSIFQPYRVRNCTIGRAYYPSNGNEAYVIGEVNANTAIFANNVVLGNFGHTVYDKATNCFFTGGVNGMVVTDTCRKTTEAELKLDDDFRPAKDSPLVDAGSNGYVKSGEADVYGGQRVYNGTVDVGAVEYDWRGDYAKDIAKREVVVTAADPQVVEREGKVTLDPGASLAAEWTPVGESARCDVKASVTGTGTLTVSVDGAAIGTVTAADSPKTFNFAGAIGETSKIVFSYSQEEDDEGCAVIEKVGSQKGLLLLVR